MDLDYKQSTQLRRCDHIAHAFFTRVGGVSQGIYVSLNCGLGSDDRQEDVRVNRSRVAQALNVEPDNLVGVYQIHSDKVETLNAPRPHASAQKADALVTKTPGLALSIATADCAPVLFCDDTSSVVGAAHAGWKGAFAGVIEQTVEAMEQLGAIRSNISAAIGPCISQAAYEVGDEFRAQFLEKSAGHQKYFEPGKVSGKWQFNLQGFVGSRLAEADIAGFETLNLCTYAREDLFFSYRRTTHRGEEDYGRMLSCIAIKADA